MFIFSHFAPHLCSKQSRLTMFVNQNANKMQPQRFNFCQYFGLMFLTYCAVQNKEGIVKKSVAPTTGFITEYEWTHINYTWPSPEVYHSAIQNGVYIPENNVMAGIKFHKDKLYVAVARVRQGSPVTLASLSRNANAANGGVKRNLLLSPFPSWSMNVQNSCTTLQNVHSMEIDRRGILWVLDGTRINGFTACPPKLVLFDLNNGNKVVGRYIFSDELCLSDGGFLNDLVLDESDGGYAYITDNSGIDPGLIVFSRNQRRAWKLRDKSMFPEMDATNFTVDGAQFTAMAPIDGVALSPLPLRRDHERIVYYTALSGFNLYAISTKILQNERFCKGDQWRRYVKYVGRKSATTDGMLIDNQGNLFFGLIGTYGIGKWNIYEYFSTARQIDYNPKEIIWPDSFAMDLSGYLYVLTNGIHKYFNHDNKLDVTDKVKFRILKLYTGSKNYMYTSQ